MKKYLLFFILLMPFLIFASTINNITYSNGVLTLKGDGPFQFDAYPLNDITIIFVLNTQLKSPIDIEDTGDKLITTIKARDFSTDSEKKVCIMLYNTKPVHFNFDKNGTIKILEGPETYPKQSDKIMALANDRYINLGTQIGDEMFSHEIYDESTLVYDDVYKKAYYIPLSIINKIRMELGMSPVKTGGEEEVAKATTEETTPKEEETVVEETTSEETTPATTTEVTKEETPTATEEVVEEETTPTTENEEVVEEEVPETTTEVAKTEQETTEENVKKETEQPKEEVVQSEEETTTTPKTEEKTVEKETTQPKVEETTVTEEQPVEEKAAPVKAAKPKKQLYVIPEIKILQEADVTRVQIIADKKLMYEFSKNDKKGYAQVKIYNATYNQELPKKSGYIKALSGNTFKKDYILTFGFSKNSEFSIFPIDKMIEIDITKPVQKESYNEEVVQLSTTTHKKEFRTSTLSERKTYRGYKRISLHLANASIDSVLRLISMEANINIYHDPNVKGKISIDVTNQPWEPTLDVILKNYGYTYEWEGNKTIRVTTLNTLEKEKAQLKKEKKQKQDLLPLYTRIYQLGFAKAAEVASIIKPPLISDRGKVDFNARSNILIVRDIKSKLDKIDKIIKELDEETKQVNILVRIYRLNDVTSKSLGINWSINNAGNNSTDTSYSGGANMGAAAGSQTLGQNYGMVSVFSQSQMMNIEAALSALMSQNKVTLETYPNITVLNHQTANIVIGQKVPITMLDQAGNTITQLTTVGTKISVTPHINANGDILLKIHPELSNLAGVVAGLVNIATSEADTTMIVKNGQTAVIGGLVEYRYTKTNSLVPFLGKIPILGLLFKKKDVSLNKGEIIIFVTPKIIEGD